MRVKAVVTDVDYTLTDERLRIRPETLRFIQFLRNAGLEVILCSGRGVYEIYMLALYIGASPLVVAENGAVTCVGGEIEVLGDKSILNDALTVLRGRFGEKIRNASFTPRICELVLERNFPIDEAVEVLREAGVKVNLMDSGVAYLVTPSGVDKWSAVLRVLEKVKINPEEIVAVGDHENDVPILSNAKYSVAVANAARRAKEHARYVSVKPYWEGFIEGVSKIISEVG